jgi:hypothetical protein
MKNFNEGDNVKWKWANGHGMGKIKKEYTSDVTKTIKGNQVKRNASANDPAYLLVQEDGCEVLKSGSELMKG